MLGCINVMPNAIDLFFYLSGPGYGLRSQYSASAKFAIFIFPLPADSSAISFSFGLWFSVCIYISRELPSRKCDPLSFTYMHSSLSSNIYLVWLGVGNGRVCLPTLFLFLANSVFTEISHIFHFFRYWPLYRKKRYDFLLSSLSERFLFSLKFLNENT